MVGVVHLETTVALAKPMGKYVSDDGTASTSSGEALEVPTPTLSPVEAQDSQADVLPACLPCASMELPSMPCTPMELPSVGSLGHSVGQCSRCCFHPKGRCLNGYNCRYCHFDHEKRPRKKKNVISVLNKSAEICHEKLAPPLQPVQPRHMEHFPWVSLASPLPLPQSPALATAVDTPPRQPILHRSWCPPPMLGSPFRTVPQSASLTVPPVSNKPELCSYPPAGPENALHGGLQPIESWSIEKVSEWLAFSGLDQYVANFQDHRITGDVLVDLSQDDLAEIGVHAVGDRKRILRAIALLRIPAPQLCEPGNAQL